MPLKIMTLTGVDEDTSPNALVALHRAYPFVEFGVLYAPDIAGSGRYPAAATIAGLKRHGLPLALHICGRSAVTEFLANADSITGRLANGYPRVQLNVETNELDLDALSAALARNPNQTVITQHAEGVDRYHWSGIKAANHAVLFDSSRGCGISPAHWPAPLPRWKPVGYAGGINLYNLDTALPAIEFAASHMGIADPIPDYWADLETGARDERDRFSIPKCESILKRAKALTPTLR